MNVTADNTSGGQDPRSRPCFYCSEPVDPFSMFTWRRVTGWERKARAATRKSGSDITLREPRDEYAHDHCIGRAKAKLASGQGALL